MKQGITAHMIVKNEDQWIWYSIQSVLPFVDQMIITDTGSSDKTISIIKSINSPKIRFFEDFARNRRDVTNVRQNQIDQTKTNWIWIVDGDEIYPKLVAQEILGELKDSKWSAVVVRRLDLLGDIYHSQFEHVGSYNMFGQRGHLLIRLLNQDKLPNLTVRGDYPLESYYSHDICVNDLSPSDVYISKGALYHTMYLKRSSLGSNLNMFNRGKYKIEMGRPVSTKYPEIFDTTPKDLYLHPLKKRSFGYVLAASLITPIKKLKRKFL